MRVNRLRNFTTPLKSGKTLLQQMTGIRPIDRARVKLPWYKFYKRLYLPLKGVALGLQVFMIVAGMTTRYEFSPPWTFWIIPGIMIPTIVLSLGASVKHWLELKSLDKRIIR